MTQYNQGTKFEYQIRDTFVASGYTVIRSAGSKGAVDLIAWNDAETHLIQCKKERKKTNYSKDVARLRSVATPQGWIKSLWIKQGNLITILDVMSGESTHSLIKNLKKVAHGSN